MTIPKHLLEAKICNEETCKLVNTIPTNDDLQKMVTQLVVENANMKTKIEEAIKYIKECQLGVDVMDRPYMLLDQEEGKDLLNILESEVN